MAFEIGQRVTSSWSGPGTVSGELEKDSDTLDNGKIVVTGFQRVKFDSPMLGERRWEIKKLTPLDDESA
jgi:hypothetical protein